MSSASVLCLTPSPRPDSGVFPHLLPIEWLSGKARQRAKTWLEALLLSLTSFVGVRILKLQGSSADEMGV